jgi:hypothetical protein
MDKKKIKSLYKKYPQLFREVIVEDIIGEIPDSKMEPAADFMATAGAKWEKWLLYMSWILQRKSVSEPTRGDFYLGMLFLTKLLLILASKKAPPEMRPQEGRSKPKEKDPLKGVEEFINQNKKPKTDENA